MRQDKRQRLMLLLTARWRLLNIRWRRLYATCRHVVGELASDLRGSLHGTRLRRRLRWWGLILISRRRIVVLPVLGPVSLMGVRLWVLCAGMALWGLVRVS